MTSLLVFGKALLDYRPDRKDSANHGDYLFARIQNDPLFAHFVIMFASEPRWEQLCSLLFHKISCHTPESKKITFITEVSADLKQKSVCPLTIEENAHSIYSLCSDQEEKFFQQHVEMEHSEYAIWDLWDIPSLKVIQLFLQSHQSDWLKKIFEKHTKKYHQNPHVNLEGRIQIHFYFVLDLIRAYWQLLPPENREHPLCQFIQETYFPLFNIQKGEVTPSFFFRTLIGLCLKNRAQSYKSDPHLNELDSLSCSSIMSSDLTEKCTKDLLIESLGSVDKILDEGKNIKKW